MNFCNFIFSAARKMYKNDLNEFFILKYFLNVFAVPYDGAWGVSKSMSFLKYDVILSTIFKNIFFHRKYLIFQTGSNKFLPCNFPIQVNIHSLEDSSSSSLWSFVMIHCHLWKSKKVMYILFKIDKSICPEKLTKSFHLLDHYLN